MPDLYITQAIPNPAGKDRAGNQASNEQLNGEWIEFMNNTSRPYSMDGIRLNHYTFDAYCRKTGEETLTHFNNTMQVGTSLRVHSGSGEPRWDGTLRHVYVGRSNFAWNNRCGDTAVLRTSTDSIVDWTAYDANPGEGTLLRRLPNTNKLV